VSLVLASASRSRAQILKAASIAFKIVPARIDEEGVRRSMVRGGHDGASIAEALAELKALQVSRARPGDFVIGADQILSFDGEIVSKCNSLAEAAAVLRRLRGRCHDLLGGIVIANNGSPIWRYRSKARLWMRQFSDEFLAAYMRGEGEILLESVGCYRLEGRGIQLFDAIDGDYFAILGLDLLPLLAALREQGVVTA
jgi:septum formation protein